MSLSVSWLNPTIDWADCRERLLHDHRVQIPNILRPEIAERLRVCLQTEIPWDVAFRENGQGKTIRSDVWRAMAGHERTALHQSVCAQARQGFQFWYFSYMMVTAYLEQRIPGHFLNTVLEWLNSDEFLQMGRKLSGFTDIRKADAQATYYGPGCFLNSHDDSGAPQGQVRRMAYVLSLTTQWRADWGGLLHFTDSTGKVIDTMVPRFNTLNLFLTPQSHEVSYVAPYATQPRISITGWLRAD